MYAPTLCYNIDVNSPCSDLQIFQWKGTTVGASRAYYYNDEEWKTTLLYMYNNIVEMDQYFK